VKPQGKRTHPFPLQYDAILIKTENEQRKSRKFVEKEELYVSD
jgi:hypothetical protein